MPARRLSLNRGAVVAHLVATGERGMAERDARRDGDDAVDARATLRNASIVRWTSARPAIVHERLVRCARDRATSPRRGRRPRARSPSSPSPSATERRDERRRDRRVEPCAAPRAPRPRSEQRERSRRPSRRAARRVPAAAASAAWARAATGYARNTTDSKSLTSAPTTASKSARCSASQRRDRGGWSLRGRCGGAAGAAVVQQPVRVRRRDLAGRRSDDDPPRRQRAERRDAFAGALDQRAGAGEEERHVGAERAREREPIALARRHREVPAHRGAQDRRGVARAAAEPARRPGCASQARRSPVRNRAARERAHDELSGPTAGSSQTKAAPAGRLDRDIVVEPDRQHQAAHAMISVIAARQGSRASG